MAPDVAALREPAQRVAKRVGASLSRRVAVRRALLGRPALRGRALVLLWHRVGPDGPSAHEAVPTVPLDVFRHQLLALRELGDVVPLADLDTGEADQPPRFAVTFDDDDVRHARHALPVLRELGVPATFFLSGRWLHGLGPYWWEVLETKIAASGLQVTASRLGVAAPSPVALAARVEGTAHADRLAAEAAAGGADVMTGDHARALAAAGMEIGFHTVHHPIMPLLDDAAVTAAASEGRAGLAADVGRPVERFAYPHGRADARAAASAEAAGYVSAWTTSHLPAGPADDPYLRGRWEPRDRDGDAFVWGVLRRLAWPRAPAHQPRGRREGADGS